VLDNDRIVGRWDRVDNRNGDVVVVDFKSSEIRQQKDADRRAKESLQLSIYALAYQQIYEHTPTAIELYFLETDLIGQTEVTEKMLNKAVENIKAAAQGIRSRDYTPKPGYMTCTYCAYSEVCPATLKNF
jgi:DNA helicase-2/ATP-dependent DNA helicase PcrA